MMLHSEFKLSIGLQFQNCNYNPVTLKLGYSFNVKL